jgi:site-specific recombinase XerD
LISFAPKGIKAGDVDAHLIRAWLAANPQWKRSTPSLAVRSVKAALRWGVDEEWIPKHPLGRFKSPQAETRGEADPELVKRVLEEVSENARHILLFMYWTGARPGEAMSVDAEGVDLDQGTAYVVGKRGPRTVVIASSFMPTIRELVKLRPTGPLFVNDLGGRWRLNALNMQVLRAKERMGVTGDFVPYHLRGIFATERIAAGADLSTVGKLLGHSGIATLHKHYHKPALETLREAVEAGAKKKPRRKPGPKKR